MMYPTVHRNRALHMLVIFLILLIFQSLPSTYPKASAEDLISQEQVTSFYTNGFLSYRNIAFRFIPEDARKIAHPDLLIQRIQKFYDVYTEMMGNAPFNGAQISFVERCDASEGKTDTTTTAECPYGYAIGYWGYFIGTPDITISKSGIKNIIEDANTHDAVTFGVAHELSHAFDYWDNAQYIYNSTSAEALANIKLVHAIDKTGVQIRLGNTTYSSTSEFLSMFYLPFYDTYLSRNYTYSDLDDDNPVVGDKADMYLALLEQGIQKTSDTCFFDTLKQYPNNPTIEVYPAKSIREKRDQFFLLWSKQCQSTHILDVFYDAHFFSDQSLRNEVQNYLNAATTTVAQVPFVDIAGHFAQHAISKLFSEGIISGKTQSQFDPDGILNRAEAAKVLVKVFLPSDAKETFISTFTQQHPNYSYVYFPDVSLGEWFAGYVGILKSIGIIQGVSTTAFLPAQAITRAEFLKMVLYGMGVQITDLSDHYVTQISKRFKDVSEDAWYYSYVYAAAALGIIEEREFFEPNRALTRGEAAVVLTKIVQ